MSSFSTIHNAAKTKLLLELARPSLLVSMYYDEVCTSWKDKTFDVLRFRVPRKTKLVPKDLTKLTPCGDKIVFRRYQAK